MDFVSASSCCCVPAYKHCRLFSTTSGSITIESTSRPKERRRKNCRTSTRCNLSHIATRKGQNKKSQIVVNCERKTNHCFFFAPTFSLLDTMQQTATHCNRLQQTATHCTTLHQTATHCTTLQHTATKRNTLQHTATHCNTLQHYTTPKFCEFCLLRRSCSFK